MKKIVMVEDSEIQGKALADALQDADYEVHRASNGEEGYGLVKDVNPDLILLDIVMPKMSGLEMLKKLDEEGLGKNTPVIVLSNLSGADSIEKALSAGVQEYLVKSDWKLEDISKKIKEKLN